MLVWLHAVRRSRNPQRGLASILVTVFVAMYDIILISSKMFPKLLSLYHAIVCMCFDLNSHEQLQHDSEQYSTEPVKAYQGHHYPVKAKLQNSTKRFFKWSLRGYYHDIARSCRAFFDSTIVLSAECKGFPRLCKSGHHCSRRLPAVLTHTVTYCTPRHFSEIIFGVVPKTRKILSSEKL